jgi:hypothetical protein
VVPRFIWAASGEARVVGSSEVGGDCAIWVYSNEASGETPKFVSFGLIG